MLTSIRSSWVCLYVWVCGVSSSPVIPQTEVKVVVENDMNVLMYGVIQFSDSLHHTYQNTEATLARITHAITHTEHLVQRLDQDTEDTIRSKRQIKDRLCIIQAEAAVLHAQAHQTKTLLHKVEQEDTVLKQKLFSLEATVNRFTPNRIQTLQAMAQKHNTHLHDLRSWTKKHKLQLENQNQQVDELQKQINRSITDSWRQSETI